MTDNKKENKNWSDIFVMTTFSASVQQNYQFGQYTFPCSDDSNLKVCATGDSEIDCTYCFAKTNSPICVKPDPGVCGSYTGSDGGDILEGVAITSNQFDTYFTVECTFFASAFNDIDNVDAYINVFGRDSNYKGDLMKNFCKQTSSNCATDPTTGNPMTSCLFLNDNGDSGNECREWYSLVGSGADATMQTYCGNNPTAPDCKCINRASDPIYQAIKTGGGDSIPDQCWWSACAAAGPPGNLVNSALLDQSVCPSTLCQDINNIIGNIDSNITQGDLTSNINCPITTVAGSSTNGNGSNGNGGNGSNGNGGNGSNGNGGSTNVQPSSNTFINDADTWWDKYKIWIILAIVGIILILIFVFIFFHGRQSAAKAKKANTSKSGGTTTKTTSSATASSSPTS
jgi:hypothetical protein